MNTTHRSVAIIGRIVNKDGILTVEFQFQFLGKARRFYDTLSFKRMVEEEQSEQHDSQ